MTQLNTGPKKRGIFKKIFLIVLGGGFLLVVILLINTFRFTSPSMTVTPAGRVETHPPNKSMHKTPANLVILKIILKYR